MTHERDIEFQERVKELLHSYFMNVAYTHVYTVLEACGMIGVQKLNKALQSKTVCAMLCAHTTLTPTMIRNIQPHEFADYAQSVFKLRIKDLNLEYLHFQGAVKHMAQAAYRDDDVRRYLLMNNDVTRNYPYIGDLVTEGIELDSAIKSALYTAKMCKSAEEYIAKTQWANGHLAELFPEITKAINWKRKALDVPTNILNNCLNAEKYENPYSATKRLITLIERKVLPCTKEALEIERIFKAGAK